MSAILDAILPVFVVASVGYLLRRRVPLDPRTLAYINTYILIPALIMSSLSKQRIEWALLGRFACASVGLFLVMVFIIHVISRWRRSDAESENAFMMTSFVNLGNFGLPVVIFAFKDQDVLPLAILVMICGSFMQNTLGMYFAQRSRMTVWDAFRRVFGFPIVYAFAAAIILQHIPWRLPLFTSRAIEITAGAVIPLQLLIVGIKLGEARLEMGVDVFIACFLRLCVGPCVAVGAAWLIGLDGLPAKVFILQNSGPVAVGMAAYGVQFNCKPGFLASVVSWTFLLSAITVSIVLAILYRL